MEFVLLKTRGDLFRLFGFYHSDILEVSTIGGISELKSFVKLMIEANVLTKNRGRSYYKSLKKGDTELPVNLGKPCQFLSLYYPDDNKNTRTILLKLKPLFPITY